MNSPGWPTKSTVSEGKTHSAAIGDSDVDADEVSNNLLEYFGPALVGPFVVAMLAGAVPFRNILLFVVPYVVITSVFPGALWAIRKFGIGDYKRIDQVWYLSAAVLNALLPWLIRPDTRWSFYGLALIFSAIAASDTLTVSLRPDHRWKSLLAVTSASYASYMLTQGAWVLTAYCLAFGVHLSGGHDAIQGVVRHLRQQRRQSDALATTDPLTGLVNRRGLSRFVRAAVEDGDSSLLVVAVDIDDFKQINDRFGHHGGDAALVHLATHMRQTLGPSWVVARSGGDEFTCASTAGTVANAERALLAVPSFICEDTVVSLRVSAGVASGPPDEALLRDASAALRLSKRNGKHRITEVDENLRKELDEARRLGAQLADAVHRCEIEIWAQPIVHLTGDRSGRVHSYECLARWATPEGVNVPPSTFIPMIEGQRLSRELGETIIAKAAQFATHLDDDVSVSVNVSASHFSSHGFTEFLHATLERHRLDASRLTIEITESEDIPADTGSSGVARQLTKMGVGLAIDDFGTGYASLERLVQFPYSQLKLDRTILAAASGSGLEFVLEGFGKMSQMTAIQMVAEGVESKEQADLLKRLGIPLAQGFHFGRPRPIDEVLRDRLKECAISGPLGQIASVSASADSVMSTTEVETSGRATRSSHAIESNR